MKYQYHIIVIGAGSAGLTVASGCKMLGAKVALIEADAMGGDCLNTGCVPSKAFLQCTHLAKEVQGAEKFGINTGVTSVNISKVMDHVRKSIESIAPHDSIEKYEKMGVDVFLGRGEIAGKHSVKVGDIILTGKSIVIATGSTPYVPPIKGLSDVDYLTNNNIFDLVSLPKHLVVLGAGPIGLELGQGFRHLGSDVTMIDMAPDIFGNDDIEVSNLMKDLLTKEGIVFHLNSKIKEVKTDGNQKVVVTEHDGKLLEIAGDKILVSLGRKPLTSGLGLDSVDIQLNKKGYIQTDARLRTNIKNIYSCGDVAGPYLFTNTAGYQASVVIKNVVFGLGLKANYFDVPWATYTKPEVAHVGYTEQKARSKNIFKESIVVQINENDRAITEDKTDGFLKMIIGKKNRLIGITIVSDKAGELISLATLAVKNKLSSLTFMGMMFAYPTQSEIYMAASLKKMNSSLSKWQIKLIKLLFLR